MDLTRSHFSSLVMHETFLPSWALSFYLTELGFLLQSMRQILTNISHLVGAHLLFGWSWLSNEGWERIAHYVPLCPLHSNVSPPDCICIWYSYGEAHHFKDTDLCSRLLQNWHFDQKNTWIWILNFDFKINTSVGPTYRIQISQN